MYERCTHYAKNSGKHFLTVDKLKLFRQVYNIKAIYIGSFSSQMKFIVAFMQRWKEVESAVGCKLF